MAGWMEGLNAPDLGIMLAGKHYAATQTMDEEKRQNINYNGAFGHEGAAIRSVRKADEATVSFSALLLKAGQDAGMGTLADERGLEDQHNFSVLTWKGGDNYKVYDECSWARIAVASTLEQVTLTADISYPFQ